MVELREIADDELERWVELHRAVRPRDAATAEEMLDWRRQAEQAAWFEARVEGEPAGIALCVLGWHAPPGVGHGDVAVLQAARGRGVGAALLARIGAYARERRFGELMGSVPADDGASLRWAAQRGFREVGRNSLLALDLKGIAAPDVGAPDGIEIVTWAEHPDAARGMYEVAREAYADVPGGENNEIASFEEWLSMDMQGTSDRPEATFVALAGDKVVGYAKLALSEARPDVAFHDMTGVRRAWRGRGIAGGLKRAEIRWAKEHGFSRLETYNEERNEPIRRLNERHGYRPEPGNVVVRGPIPE